MKNYTQKAAGLIAGNMDMHRNYSESELIVITYGLELFLNSVIKAIMYILIGIVSGKFVEAVLAMAVLVILRSISGGYHAKTDAGCLFLTGAMIYMPIILTDYLTISKEIYIEGAFVAIILYLLFSPEDEKYIQMNTKKINLIKMKILLRLFMIFLFGFCMEEDLRVIALLITIEQALSIMKERRRRKRNERKNYYED